MDELERFMKPNSVRIISGQWRGRKLPILDRFQCRPTPDRVRETLFNWLMPHLADSRVLDLFAGTGVLGLECLSRGADSITLVDQDKKIIDQLHRNIQNLSIPSKQAQIIHQDAMNFLSNPPPDRPTTFDLVFLDPPYASSLLNAVIPILNSNPWLSPNAFVYVESHRDTDFETPTNWRAYREKTAGQVAYRLYQIVLPNSTH